MLIPRVSKITTYTSIFTLSDNDVIVLESRIGQYIGPTVVGLLTSSVSLSVSQKAPGVEYLNFEIK